MSGEQKIKIVLDTDIADDIDDAIALCFALGSPEFDLLGVTVVYGDVEVRAKVARALLRAAGRDDVPVIAGYERPLEFRWHPGTAPEAPSQRAAAAGDDEPVPRGAPEFIAETARRFPGEVHLLTIGALTNAAAALCSDPSLAGALAGVVSMAGYLPPARPQAEWNVRYDPLAGQVLAASGVRWTAVPADVQGDNGLTQREFRALAEAGGPLCELLLRLIVLMKRHKGAGDPACRTIQDVRGVHVADVMTLASFLVGEQMDLAAGTISVDGAGRLSFAPGANGPHRCARAKLPGSGYRDEIVRRIAAAGRGRPPRK